MPKSLAKLWDACSVGSHSPTKLVITEHPKGVKQGAGQGPKSSSELSMEESVAELNAAILDAFTKKTRGSWGVEQAGTKGRTQIFEASCIHADFFHL